MTRAEYSKLLGIKKSHLNHILTGHRSPSGQLAMALEKRSGVPVKVWLGRDGLAIKNALAKIHGAIPETRGRKKKK